MTELKNNNQIFVKEIFDQGKYYNINQYQRSYVWSNKEINRLLEDLYFFFLHKENNEKYLLGFAIFNETIKKCEDTNLQFICQEIVDGQQRLISLTLIFLAFKHLTKNEEMKKNINEQLYQEFNEFKRFPEKQKILFSCKQDSLHFKKIFLKNDNVNLKDVNKKNLSNSLNNIINNFQTILKWFENKLKKEEIELFYNCIINDIEFSVFSTKNDSFKAYKLFSALNDTGIKLTLADCFKGKQISLLETEEEKNFYSKKWSFYESFKHNLIKSFSFESFLLTIVQPKITYLVKKKGSLNQIYDFMNNKQKESLMHLPKGKATFDFIGENFNNLQNILNCNLSLSNNDIFLFKKILSLFVFFSNFNSFTIVLMHFRNTFGDAYILDFLIKLENLSSYNWLVNRKNDNVIQILKKINEANKNNISSFDFMESMKEFMQKQFNDPKAKNLKDFLLNEEFGKYRSTTVNKIKYLLLKLDFLKTPLTENFNINKEKKSKLHLMPKEENKKYAKKTYDFYLHKLGNLVLVNKDSKPLNKIIKHTDDYKEIKKILFEKNLLNDRVYSKFVFNSYKGWTAENVEKNHKNSVSLLFNYYKANNLDYIKTNFDN